MHYADAALGGVTRYGSNQTIRHISRAGFIAYELKIGITDRKQNNNVTQYRRVVTGHHVSWVITARAHATWYCDRHA